MIYHTVDAPFIPKGSGEPRSEGLHLTDVIRSIQKELGWEYKGPGFDDRDLTMEIGFWWEDVLSTVFAERMASFRPGEITKDGIIGSPDGIGPDPGITTPEVVIPPSNNVVLEEYKCTWKSMRNKVVDDWYYMTQGKAYCYMVGVTVCVWRVCYLMGDYKGSGPRYRVCRVEFDDAELHDNWEMILNHAKEKEML